MFSHSIWLSLVWVIFLPCLSAIFVGFFRLSKYFNWKLSVYILLISLSLVVLTSLLSLLALNVFTESFASFLSAESKLFLLNQNLKILFQYNWLECGALCLQWSFLFDQITLMMVFVVSFISLMVHIYSLEYMKDDPRKPLFFSYLSLFTFFMLFLVTSNNFIQLFVGWEGVGLCSYLLINFWYLRIQANKAAIKAMLVNKIGDCALLFGISLIYLHFRTLEFDLVFLRASLFHNINSFLYDTPLMLNFDVYNYNCIDIICYALFIGAMAKSAQIGLHTWLPDAMEGPTPVSALIHAATMVTAGVFLLIRCSALFELSSSALSFIVFIGSTTCFFAATVALVQHDLKKIIAYSTCSQLGYMVLACGLSAYNVALFHLVTHAFFKALLFLSAGSIIHALNDEQDIRKMGGLRHVLPYTATVMSLGSFALIGFPFLSGFYSKDLILEIAYSLSNNPMGLYASIFGTLTAFLTAFYSFRLVFYIFFDSFKNNIKISQHIHEPGIYMCLPLGILSIFSVSAGYYLFDTFFTSFPWSNANKLFSAQHNFEYEFLSLTLHLLPTILSCFGFFCAFWLHKNYSKFLLYLKQSYYGKKIYLFFLNKWYFDYVYNYYIIQPSFNISYFFFFKQFDKGWLEYLGPEGLKNLLGKSSYYVDGWQNGIVYRYLFIFAGFVIVSWIGSIYWLLYM